MKSATASAIRLTSAAYLLVSMFGVAACGTANTDTGGNGAGGNSSGNGGASAGSNGAGTGGKGGTGGGASGNGGSSAGAGGAQGGAAGTGATGGAGGVSGAGGASGTSGAAGTSGSGGSAAGDAGNGTSDGGEATACPANATLQAGETTNMIAVGGTMRSYILHVPAKYDGHTAVPLVIDFHPILSTDTFEKGNSGYGALSDQDGFIVAWPQGIDNAWDVGPCCTMSRSVDDGAFAKALVDKIKSEACVDPKRVYATGYSMGGGMSHYLACNAADVFAAVAPSAFDLLQESEEPCHPARPITVISFRGTADPIVPYAGGASNPPNGLAVTIHFLGAQGTFQKWAMLDGCTGMPDAVQANGCQTYSQCQAGTTVTLCTTQGGGHVTGDPNIGWAMLKAHPMP